MKNLLLIFIVSTFLCGSCQNSDFKKRIQTDYEQSLQFFKTEMVSHFPVTIPDSSSYRSSAPIKDDLKLFGFGVDGILLWKTYSESQYEEISSKFIKLSNNFYSSNDSALLLVFSYCNEIEIDGEVFDNQEPLERQELARHNLTTATSLPIPLFEIDDHKCNTMSGLTKDFIIYVLEAKPGRYIDDSYLEECDCLPEKWKHGYSKGVSMSDEKQVVIYWISVW